jgi:DnaD/phage-associated family protein
MKRTWITVKRGILEPKHRFALGELIWLFIYILDLANWEEGAIMEWTDKGAAEEMDMPLATLRDQRRKLEERGYISTERKRYGLRIIVHNWTNPKEYTGKKYNIKPQSDTESDTQSDTESDTQSDTESDTQSDTESVKTPDDNLHSSLYQKSKIKNQKELPPLKNNYKFWEDEISPITPAIADFIDLHEKELSKEYVHDAIYEAVSHNARSMAYVKKVLDNWRREGKRSNPQRIENKPLKRIDVLPDGSQVEVENA